MFWVCLVLLLLLLLLFLFFCLFVCFLLVLFWVCFVFLGGGLFLFSFLFFFFFFFLSDGGGGGKHGTNWKRLINPMFSYTTFLSVSGPQGGQCWTRVFRDSGQIKTVVSARPHWATAHRSGMSLVRQEWSWPRH